jgi:hypothetical protein
LVVAACGGSAAGGSTDGGFTPDGSGGSAAGGGSTGQSGSGASSSLAEQCVADVCSDFPDCPACQAYCEDTCSTHGCGGFECPVAYVEDCFAGKTCEAIASQSTLVKDAELYACLNGQPSNEICSFGGGSPTACWKCTYQNCNGQLVACNADPSCASWLACIHNQDCPGSPPQNAACYRHCDDAYPNAAALYQPIYACTCAGCAICQPHQGSCEVTP